MSTIKIENHSERVISLPITDSHPEGKKILPGMNDVPLLYWEELRGYSSMPAADSAGRPRPIRYPGRELLEDLQRPVKINMLAGTKVSPQITIYAEEGQAGPEEGTPLPADLKDMAEDVAVAVIAAAKDRQRLAAWAKDSRAKVKLAATERLAALKG